MHVHTDGMRTIADTTEDELPQIKGESKGWKMHTDGMTRVGWGRSMLPACWGGGGAGCRHMTSAPPPELGSASQTASPAPAPRPAGRPYSHTAPFTR